MSKNKPEVKVTNNPKEEVENETYKLVKYVNQDFLQIWDLDPFKHLFTIKDRDIDSLIELLQTYQEYRSQQIMKETI